MGRVLTCLLQSYRLPLQIIISLIFLRNLPSILLTFHKLKVLLQLLQTCYPKHKKKDEIKEANKIDNFSTSFFSAAQARLSAPSSEKMVSAVENSVKKLDKLQSMDDAAAKKLVESIISRSQIPDPVFL